MASNQGVLLGNTDSTRDPHYRSYLFLLIPLQILQALMKVLQRSENAFRQIAPIYYYDKLNGVYLAVDRAITELIGIYLKSKFFAFQLHFRAEDECSSLSCRTAIEHSRGLVKYRCSILPVPYLLVQCFTGSARWKRQSPKNT